jgi:membrane-associated phospholipid phosphatase
MVPRAPTSAFWLLVPAACALFCLAAMAWLDRPIAIFIESQLFGPGGHAFGLLRHVLNLALDAILVLPLLGIFAIAQSCLARARGAVPAEATSLLALAGVSMAGSLAVNEGLLKPFFGRYTLDALFAHPSHYGFAFLHGTAASSFPSGHTVLLVSFLAVLMAYRPRYRALWLSAIAMALAALVIAGWHFLSDIAAGIAVGTTGAWLTMAMAARLYPLVLRHTKSTKASAE